ncbi:hypothetical protein GCM10009799_13010 [Nocardiopsis rhodophaea]|uniref:Uncharacterized protein n=1 Tax=Nocardiopsis rhodophaea TaxID=280238 RepID=A0ABN2SN74_9ACTN
MVKSGIDGWRGLGAPVVSGGAAGRGIGGPPRWSPFGWRSGGGSDEGWGHRAPGMPGLPQVPCDDHGDDPGKPDRTGTVPMIINRGNLRFAPARGPGAQQTPASPLCGDHRQPGTEVPARIRGGAHRVGATPCRRRSLWRGDDRRS